jgi:xanthine dehydrogenase iron-sulfur cluster and FAD-binding subunit A
MERNELHRLACPTTDADEILQRKREAERGVERLTAVVESIRRKLDTGSHAVTAEDLATRQRQLLHVQAALVIANLEYSACGL